MRDNKKAVEFAQEIEDHLVESLRTTCEAMDRVGQSTGLGNPTRCCISADNTAAVQKRAEMVCVTATTATALGFGTTTTCPVCPASLGVPTR